MPESIQQFEPFERRIEDAVENLLELRSVYFEPRAFRRRVSSAIQELRNVTFVLQKCGARVEGFADWYASEQETLKSDKILGWLVEARNQVVKRGDLEKHSIARVQIFDSWLSPPITTTTVPAELRPSEYAKRLSRLVPPNLTSEEALIKVERRWIHGAFPDHEIVALLDHCARRLLSLAVSLREAFLRIDSSELAEIAGRLRAVSDSAFRVSWLKMRSGDAVLVSVLTAPAMPELAMDEAVNHYSTALRETSESLDREISVCTPFQQQCRFLFKRAIAIIRTDGHHDPIAFLLGRDGGTTQVALSMPGNAEKHVVLRRIADLVLELDCRAAIIVSEVWIAPRNGRAELAEDHPARREGVQLCGLTLEGEAFCLMQEFGRVDGGIWLPALPSVETDIPFFMRPIREAFETIKIRAT